MRKTDKSGPMQTADTMYFTMDEGGTVCMELGRVVPEFLANSGQSEPVVEVHTRVIIPKESFVGMAQVCNNLASKLKTENEIIVDKNLN